MKLYSYWRSTTSMRVRAALNLKGILYEIVPVDLAKGEQHKAGHMAMNPAGGVPVLVLQDGTTMVQSMAILDWLEECYPDPPLLPKEPLERARFRAAADVLAMDVHPVNNLRVTRYLQGLGLNDATCLAWMRHWIHAGFTAYQAMIRPDTTLSFGESVSLADLCLAAQMVNARRWDADMSGFDRLTTIDHRLRALPEIAAALPENQPDAR